MSCLGYYVPDSVNALKDVVSFMDQDLLFSKGVRAVLNEMAGALISAFSENLFWEEL